MLIINKRIQNTADILVSEDKVDFDWTGPV
jgi:hypothetical protein